MPKEFHNLRVLFIVLAAVIGVPIMAFFALYIFFQQLSEQIVTVTNATTASYTISDLYESDDNGLIYAGTAKTVAPGERVVFRSGGMMSVQCFVIDGIGDMYFDPSNARERYGGIVTSQKDENLFGQSVTEMTIDVSDILVRTSTNPCPFEEGESFSKLKLYDGEVTQMLDDKDLNADGANDVITLTKIDNGMDGMSAKLYVNTSFVAVPGTNPSGKFMVVDIDTSTPGLEIVVQDDGPSSDYTVMFYTYDSEGLRYFDTLPGDIEGLEVDGSGMVETTARGLILDTWFYRDEYQFVNNALLRQEKDFYARLDDGRVKMREMIQLAASPTDSTIVGSLNAGDGATILGCDNVEWCKARSAGGVEGWFNVTAIDAYEVFDGLSYAD